MGRAPCCEKVGLKRGRWTAEEDQILSSYIQLHGEGSWRSLPKKAGLLRCGKSCRLRWINYLRSDLKRGNISAEEEDLIMRLHATLGNRWSMIAGHLAGRTDNEIKNYWNSHLSRKIIPSSKKLSQTAPLPLPANLSPIRKRTTARSKTNKSSPDQSNKPPMVVKQRPVPPDTSSSGGSGGVDRHKELIMGPTNHDQVSSLTRDDKQVKKGGEVHVVGSTGPASSSTTTNDSNNNHGKEVDWDWDWDWDWDFEGGCSMSMVGRWLDGEEEDNMLSWPWESPTPNYNNGEHDFIEVDMEKQDSMIAWLLS